MDFETLAMIDDETFPVDLDDVPYTSLNTATCVSMETFETSNFSSENYASSTDVSVCPITAKPSKANEFPESSFASFDAPNRKLELPPPKAPIKKKKSYSCQDLQMQKKNYNHVESKVIIGTGFSKTFPNPIRSLPLG